MEDRVPISSSRLTSADVARASFSPTRRGYDPREVRSYLEQVARELSGAERRIAELRERLADAERRAANPVLDEAVLASALGTQSAAILRTAHEESQRALAAATARANELLTEAQDRAATIVVDAQSHAATTVSDAEQTAAKIEKEAREGAERLVESAKTNGTVLVERAHEQSRSILAEAEDARRKILSDLLVRRKSLYLQIEQARAARDSLVAAVANLRGSVDAAMSDLENSDDRARAAAIEQLRARPVPQDDEASTGAGAQEHPSGSRSGAPVDPDAVEEIFAKLRKATLEERGQESSTRTMPRSQAPSTPVSAVLQRRDELAAGARDGLIRKVKRALQDDQNAALERVRGMSGDAVSGRLGSERDQRDRYALVSVEPLREAASAGRAFAASEGGVVGTELADDTVAELAEDLSATLVTALRKRLASDQRADATERVTAAYREWRGARTERLCADLALRAFHAGVAAASSGRNVRFVVAPKEPPCEQCNGVGASSAGGVAPDAIRLPPLHAGCRCTVLPA